MATAIIKEMQRITVTMIMTAVAEAALAHHHKTR
jgi:hypothetical protein